MNNEKIYANIESMSFYLKLSLNVKSAHDIKKFKFIEDYLTKLYEILKGEKPKKSITKMLSCVHRNKRLTPSIERVSYFSESFIECKACGEKIELKTISKDVATKTVNALIEVIMNSDSKNDKKITDINDTIKFLTLYITNNITRVNRNRKNFDYDYEDDYEDEYSEDEDKESLGEYTQHLLSNLY